MSTLKLKELCVEGYKGYRELAKLEIAPLTILVGQNNSGKSALVRAIQLLAGGLDSVSPNITEPLPLESGGIRHGESFDDLVTGRAPHRKLTLSAGFLAGSSWLSLAATVRNMTAPLQTSKRRIERWVCSVGNDKTILEKEQLGLRSSYSFSSGKMKYPLHIEWRGLIPEQLEVPRNPLAAQIASMSSWASGVRYLQCPRAVPHNPFRTPESTPRHLGSDGRLAPIYLTTDDELRESVRSWYRETFGMDLVLLDQGKYFELVVGTSIGGTKVQIEQSGRGLAHVLPVAVMALTGAKLGQGVDIIEHPEAELHPAAHASIAELLLNNLAGAVRPLIIETHSEMVLLRTRRWIAEGKLPASDVLVYWIRTVPGLGSSLQKIQIDEFGELSDWPAGVFIEDYEEVLAIRRAARRDKSEADAH